MTAPEYPGNEKLSIEQLVDDYGDMLFSYAMARVRRHDIAEDLVQETFMAAHAGLESFKGQSSPKVWLAGILRHKIVDYLRKATRNRPQDDDGEWVKSFFDKAGHWIEKPADWSCDPAAILENQSFWQVLQNCLKNLTEPVAQAFVLRVMDELPPEQVCENLDISSANLWGRLHRARIHLRRCLEINWFETDSR